MMPTEFPGGSTTGERTGVGSGEEAVPGRRRWQSRSGTREKNGMGNSIQLRDEPEPNGDGVRRGRGDWEAAARVPGPGDR